jgi:hypothetical protein
MSGTSGTIPTISGFTAGDIVVSIVGGADANQTGVAPDNAASPITLEELDPTTGTIIGQMVLPQTASGANDPISGEYGSSSEGTLQLAGNGQSLVIAGYGVNATTYNDGGAAVYGNAALAQSTSLTGQTSYTPVARVIADIGYDGSIDTSTALFNVYNLNNPRAVATVDGSVFYLGGQGNKDATQGVYEAGDGASSATAIDTANDVRDVEIYDGALYVSADSKTGPTDGIASFGDLPAAAATPAFLNGIETSVVLTAATANGVNDADLGTSVNLSPETYVFANPTTLYVADGGNPKAGGLGDGGLQKWTLNTATGTWSLDYTLSAGLPLSPDTASDGTSGLIGLTGTVNANGTITLFATTEGIADLDQTYVVSITDTVANTITPAGESFTTLLTENPGFSSTAVISGNTESNVRGIAAAPSAPTSGTVGSGQSTAAGTTVSNGSVLTVFAGGTAAVVVNSAGQLFIEGGVDSGSLIQAGGTEILAYGSATGDTIFGREIADQTGSLNTVLSGAVVSYGGELILNSATASYTTVEAGGYLSVDTGDADNIVVAGGTVGVANLGALTGTIVFSGGGQIMLQDGEINGTVTDFAGTDSIVVNQSTSETLVVASAGGNTVLTVSGSDGDSVITLSGLYAPGSLVLNAGGSVTVQPLLIAGPYSVASGFVSPDVTVGSGASYTVAAGGTAISATVASGGLAVISGLDIGTTIAAGGSEVLLGVANGDVISGIQTVSAAGATVTFETVASGGQIDLFLKGGAAVSTFVGSAGAIYVSGNATASNTVLSGGSIVLESGKAELTGGVIFDGAGTIIYSSFVSASGSSGDLAVLSGFGLGDVISLTAAAIGSGAALSTVTSGADTIATVSGTGGAESLIFSGSGVALSLVSAANGGVAIVAGTASGTTSSGTGTGSGGGLTVAAGATSTTIVSSGQTLSVLAGGSELNGTILSGGSAVIAGTDSGTRIAAGGSETLTGAAYGDQVSGVQSLTGAAAIVTGETVFSGGAVELLTAGAIASGLILQGGGSMFVNGRGSATNTVLTGGSVILDSPKATIFGTLEFATSGALVIEVATTPNTGSSGLEAVISDFDAADTIDITAFGASGATLATSTVSGNTVVAVTSGGGTETLVFAGTDAGAFVLEADGHGGVEVTVAVTSVTSAITVSSGASLVDFVVASGGAVTVASGGTVSNGIVSSGAVILSGGTDAHTIIAQGGTETVSGSGAVTINDTVVSGGTVILTSGATTSNIRLSGGQLIAGPGTAQDPTTVGAGSTDTISGAGATGTGTIIQPGGTEILVSGGVESAGSDAGLLSLSGGGTARAEMVASGGVISGLAGGVLVSGVIAAGGSAVLAGFDSGTLIRAGASALLTGSGNGDVVGGTQTIAGPLDVVNAETVLSGGLINISTTSAVTSFDVIMAGGTIIDNGRNYVDNVTISGGTLVLASAKASTSGTVSFAGSGGLVDLTAIPSITASSFALNSSTIIGFAAGDAIEAGYLSYNGATLTSAVVGANTVVTLSGTTISATAATESFSFSGTYGAGLFSLVDAGGFAEIAANPCYCTGTRILGVAGEIAVEDIAVGDELVTVRAGGPLCARVIWTGRRHLDLAQRPDAAALRPVRIAAGAIAPGVPERDLRVSPHHALYLDGLLFEAQALVNGTTITRDMAARYVTYHHVELAAHDIILAEGLAAESYLDTGNRNAFEGGAACDLFPMFDKPSMAVTCVPLVREGAALTTVRARLTQATMTQATLTQVA